MTCLTFVFGFFLKAEDGIRDLVRSRGLGDVYKRQELNRRHWDPSKTLYVDSVDPETGQQAARVSQHGNCLLYTSDAADERSSVDLGGRRIINKKNNIQQQRVSTQ